jgi:hypothetical protein
MNSNFQFLVTTYKGNEDTILALFNRNRPETQGRAYMDWRYLGERSPSPPVVFFVKSVNGKIIAMSSLILRAYWLENKKVFFAVSGDTSIDEKYRGANLGEKLFRFKTDYIDHELITYGFGIGTPSVVKILEKNSWQSVEKINEFVYSKNIIGKIFEKTRSNLLAKLLNAIYGVYNTFVLKCFINEGLSLLDAGQFDSSFDDLWDQFDKSGMTIRDRSSENLEWRYGRHPNLKFKKAKVFHKNRLVGYIIHRLDSQNNVIIYDVLFLENRFIKSSLRLLLKRYWKHERINSIRIPLINENHPYCNAFNKSGFFRRKSEGVFQMYRPKSIESSKNLKFFFTLGDKDI